MFSIANTVLKQKCVWKKIYIYIHIYNFNITAFVGLCEFFVNACTWTTLRSAISIERLIFKTLCTKFMELLSIFFSAPLHIINCSVTNTIISIRSWKSNPHSPQWSHKLHPTPDVCPFIFLTHQTNVTDDNHMTTTLTRPLCRWTGCRWMNIQKVDSLQHS